MSTYTITGFNDEGKFRCVNDILYMVDTSNTYKGHLINSTPFDDIMLEEYKQEDYKYMYENCNTIYESKNNIKKVNIVYKTLDIVEPMKANLKLKKNTKERNWKKHCKQIKKKQRQKTKSKMIKKKQMYTFDLNYNYSNYDIYWYHVYKDNINSNIEYVGCDCRNCGCSDNNSNLTFLDDDYSHLFEYNNSDNYDSDDYDDPYYPDHNHGWHYGWG
jgi:hypothetical protein